jgi:hypothetical protein
MASHWRMTVDAAKFNIISVICTYGHHVIRSRLFDWTVTLFEFESLTLVIILRKQHHLSDDSDLAN